MSERTVSTRIPTVRRENRADGRLVFRRNIGRAMRHLVLILWCSTAVFPVVWVFLNAFKDNSQIFGGPFRFPDPAIWTNFAAAYRGIHLSTTLVNSLFYSAVTVSVTLLICSMCAFYLSKIAKNNLLYVFFIMGIMIPVHAIIIPIFVTMRNFGLLNSRVGIIMVYIVTNISLSVFIITGFMRKGVPNELLEASIIDGCGPITAFFRIALPITTPALATVGTFVFLGVWNEFLFALLMLSRPALRTLNLSVYMLRGQYSSDHGLMAAGVIILVTPAIIIYTLFQEQVVKGLTAGALKG
ncbi:MAG: carbohydrate ABC transporter permease [Spirochaetaceae bacterium]|nr:MAG: carbohydrate ABC transporter permease [Spirochaetaceae bacterium]